MLLPLLLVRHNASCYTPNALILRYHLTLPRMLQFLKRSLLSVTLFNREERVILWSLHRVLVRCSQYTNRLCRVFENVMQFSELVFLSRRAVFCSRVSIVPFASNHPKLETKRQHSPSAYRARWNLVNLLRYYVTPRLTPKVVTN